MATRIGLEPTTPSVTGWCSNQLSYRAMIAQVRAASYRGNVLYYIGNSVCCQAQICEKYNFLQNGIGMNSLSQNLTVLPAPSGREPLAHPQASHFSRRLCRHAKGPIPEGAVERSETGGVPPKKQTAQAPKNLCGYGRGSKSRTHGTRFWRPLLYQLSYTPKSMLHSLNACLLYKIRRKMSSINFQVLVLQPQQPSLAAGRL